MNELKLPSNFNNDRINVCIQGLGFVGAAMALAVADAKDKNNNNIYNVIGIEADNIQGQKKVNKVNDGVFPFKNTDKKLLEVQERVSKTKNLYATTNSKFFKFANIIIVDINLDVFYDNDKPKLDLTLFKKAIKTIGENAKPGSLIIVETTVPPGTCEKIVYPILMQEFKKRNLPQNLIFVAHSYERIMPGSDYFDSIVNYWRVYSGITQESKNKCREFLETIINTEQYPLTCLDSTTASETAKVLENSYRAANIAFITEWGEFAEKVGINLFEVVSAIRKRPTHSNIRQPGFGVGGYCLTKDPFFAPLAAKELFNVDVDFPFSTKAVEVNNHMPEIIAEKLRMHFNKNLKDKKILLLGVSYRPDVADTRHSPSEIFVKKLLNYDAEVICSDPLVKHWNEMDIDVLNDIPSLSDFDAVILAVSHKEYKNLYFDKISSNRDILIFDTNNVLSDKQIIQLKSNHYQFMAIGRGDK